MLRRLLLVFLMLGVSLGLAKGVEGLLEHFNTTTESKDIKSFSSKNEGIGSTSNNPNCKKVDKNTIIKWYGKDVENYYSTTSNKDSVTDFLGCVYQYYKKQSKATYAPWVVGAIQELSRDVRSKEYTLYFDLINKDMRTPGDKSIEERMLQRTKKHNKYYGTEKGKNLPTGKKGYSGSMDLSGFKK